MLIQSHLLSQLLWRGEHSSALLGYLSQVEISLLGMCVHLLSKANRSSHLLLLAVLVLLKHDGLCWLVVSVVREMIGIATISLPPQAFYRSHEVNLALKELLITELVLAVGAPVIRRANLLHLLFATMVGAAAALKGPLASLVLFQVIVGDVALARRPDLLLLGRWGWASGGPLTEAGLCQDALFVDRLHHGLRGSFIRCLPI